MSPRKQSIESLFTEICDMAYHDAQIRFGFLSSTRKPKDHPTRKPGYYYNNLPEDVKERLRKELRSEHTQNILRSLLLCGPVEDYEDRDVRSSWNSYRQAKLDFEKELMRNGWKPNLKF